MTTSLNPTSPRWCIIQELLLTINLFEWRENKLLMMINFEKNFSRLIKVLSPLLITGALSLEVWNLYAELVHHSPLPGLTVIFWVGRFALISHGIEAIIAAIYAPSRQRSPLVYGIYTFFVGTVGLVELLRETEIRDNL
jgi:hypothetical protein